MTANTCYVLSLPTDTLPDDTTALPPSTGPSVTIGLDQFITVGGSPAGVMVNPVTNDVYVANIGAGQKAPSAFQPGSVSVISRASA